MFLFITRERTAAFLRVTRQPVGDHCYLRMLVRQVNVFIVTNLVTALQYNEFIHLLAPASRLNYEVIVGSKF